MQKKTLSDPGISNFKNRNVRSPSYIDALVTRDRDTDANGTLDERLFPQHDANFNVTAITNTSGTVQERYTPDPFGVVTFRNASGNTISASAKDWVFLHQGGQADILGHYDFRNRILRPTLGRWLTNDPLGFAAGDNNFYGYLANGPGNGLDPSGLEVRVEGTDSRFGHHRRIVVDLWDEDGKKVIGHFGISFAWEADPNDPNAPNGIVYKDNGKTGVVDRRLPTTPDQDRKIKDILEKRIGDREDWRVLDNNCRNYSHRRFEEIKKEFDIPKETNTNPKNHPDPITGRDSGIPIRSGDYKKDKDIYDMERIANIGRGMRGGN